MQPEEIQSVATDECISAGAKIIGWAEKRVRKDTGVKRRGVGMATMEHASGAAPLMLEHSNACIKLNEDGSAVLVVSPCEMGQGILGVLAQIAAEELGLRPDDIHVVSGDTDITRFDVGSHASRSTYVIGNAVLKAAREVKRKVLERAAIFLDVSVDKLEAQNGRVYDKSNPEKEISISEVVKEAMYNFKQQCLQITGEASHEATTLSPPGQACFAEVEVNTETGEVKVLKLVIAHDIGKAINPMNVEGQLEGGVVQGLGFCLSEDFIFDTSTGETITDNFNTYKLLSTLDLPEIEVLIVEEGDPIGPYGAKGVGETGMVIIAPAIANAIYHAIGVRIKDLPITPEKILQALKNKQT
ncbi:MAG: molybdopterin cofactor-binding domain-containing protein [Pseudomonadota bacterium]